MGLERPGASQRPPPPYCQITNPPHKLLPGPALPAFTGPSRVTEVSQGEGRGESMARTDSSLGGLMAGVRGYF